MKNNELTNKEIYTVKRYVDGKLERVEETEVPQLYDSVHFITVNDNTSLDDVIDSVKSILGGYKTLNCIEKITKDFNNMQNKEQRLLMKSIFIVDRKNIILRYNESGNEIKDQIIAEEKEVFEALEELEKDVVDVNKDDKTVVEILEEANDVKEDVCVDLSQSKMGDEEDEDCEVSLTVGNKNVGEYFEKDVIDESTRALDEDEEVDLDYDCPVLDNFIKYSQADVEMTKAIQDAYAARDIYNAYGVNVDLETPDNNIVEFSVNGREFSFYDDVNITVIPAPVFGCDILLNHGLCLTSRNLSVTLETQNASEILVEGIFKEDIEVTIGDLVNIGLAYIVENAFSTIYVEDGHIVRSFLDIADEECLDELLG